MYEYIIGAIIVLVVLLLVWFLLKRWFSALLSDSIDLVLSFADELFGGVLLDWGDFIAGFIIFYRERKVVGTIPAIFIFWETINLFPINYIPIIGSVVELVTNFFPAVTLFRLLFSKFSKANFLFQSIKQKIALCKKNNLACYEEVKKFEEVSKLISNNNFVDFIDKVKPIDNSLDNKLMKLSNQKIDEVSSMLDDFISKLNEAFNQIDIDTDSMKLTGDKLSKFKSQVNLAHEAVNHKHYVSALKMVEDLSNDITGFSDQMQKFLDENY